MSLARDLVTAIREDPAALAELRQALDVQHTDPAPAYTVARLAAVVGMTPRAVRGAIARGELRARREGTGTRTRYLIARADAEAWATPTDPERPRRPRAPQPAARSGSLAAVMNTQHEKTTT